MEYTIVIEPSPDAADVETLQRELRGFNRQHAPDDRYQPLVIVVRDAQMRLVGGLLGETYWGWLHISILWLDHAIRGQGFGRRVLEAAECEAFRRNCHHAHLDTMSFQSVSFYERCGYKAFGVLQDLPHGHSRHFMTKTLDAGSLSRNSSHESTDAAARPR